MKRKENTRAATAYQIDEGSALRIDFDETAQKTTRATPEPDFLSGWRDVQAMHAAVETERRHQQREIVLDAFADASGFARRDAEPQPARYADRIQAFLDAEYQERQQREQQQRGPEPAQPAELSTGRGDAKAERSAESLTPDQQDREAYKKALQELARMFGRELTGEEGSQTRDRGGGQTL